MKMTVQERPGVYSADSSSTGGNGGGGRKAVGLAAVCETAQEMGKVQVVTSFEQAAALFGTGEMTELIRIILRNGAGSVAAVPIADGAGYAGGFEALEKVENLAVLVCGADTHMHLIVHEASCRSFTIMSVELTSTSNMMDITMPT